MLRKSLLAAFVSVLALIATGVAAGALTTPHVFTVYGTTSGQRLVVDRNGNGQPDPGDVLSTGGPVWDTLGGDAIGSWHAQVYFAQTTASVFASFRFWQGEMLVRGSFDPSAGPPPSLNVFAGYGSFRGLSGTLAVGDGGPGVNVFRFDLHYGAPWHP